MCRTILVAAACASPLAAGVQRLPEQTAPTQLALRAPRVLGFHADVRGPQRFWIRGELEEVAILADGRSLLLEAVDVAGDPWRVSPPMLLARGEGALLVSGDVEGEGFLSSDSWGWPIAGREGEFARFIDSDSGLSDADSGPPALLVFAPEPGTAAPRLELGSEAGSVVVMLSEDIWTIRQGSTTRWVPARPRRVMSRWILHMPTRASQLVVELGRTGIRLFAEQQFVYEASGRFQLQSHEGLALRGLVPGAERAGGIRPPVGPEIGWYPAELVADDEQLRAWIYAFFLSSSFDVTASIPPGGGVVLSFESPRRFVVAECLGAAGVRVRSVDAGEVTNDVPVPGDCAAVEIEKRPGSLAVARTPIDSSFDLGSIGCLQDDGVPGCDLAVRDLSGRF